MRKKDKGTMVDVYISTEQLLLLGVGDECRDQFRVEKKTLLYRIRCGSGIT
jgi:hypothetical protein